MDRSTFETWLTALARADLLRIEDDEFVSDGRRIAFRRAFTTAAGRALDPTKLANLRMAVVMT